MVTLRYGTAAAVLCVLTVGAHAVSLGQWEELPEKELGEVFDGTDYAFDVSVNLDICSKLSRTIEIDGSEDYTKKINEQLAALGNAGGGQLKLGKGTFEHSGQILIPSYVCLVGSGIGSTVLKLKDNSPRFELSGSIRSDKSERITIMDLTQDGNKANQKEADTHGRYG